MSYKFSEHTIQLEQHDCDVNLRLPNGEVIAVQYRVEGYSIDVCLPQDLSVINWTGDDMEPAPEAEKLSAGMPHVRLAKQLCIGLNPDSVEV